MTFDEWLDKSLANMREIICEAVEHLRELRTSADDDDAEKARPGTALLGCEKRLRAEVTSLQRVVFDLSLDKAKAAHEKASERANERLVSGLQQIVASRDVTWRLQIGDYLEDAPQAEESRARDELEGVEALERAITA